MLPDQGLDSAMRWHRSSQLSVHDGSHRISMLRTSPGMGCFLRKWKNRVGSLLKPATRSAYEEPEVATEGQHLSSSTPQFLDLIREIIHNSLGLVQG